MVRFPALGLADSIAVPVVGDQSTGSYKATHSAGGDWFPLLGSLFPLEEPEAQGIPLCVVRCCPGKRQFSHYAVAPLTLFIWSILVPEVQGELQPHPCISGFC